MASSRKRTGTADLRTAQAASSEAVAVSRGGAFPIVGIGASAGGLEAFSEVLKHLPRDTGMGFVPVQHLDPSHESALAHALSRVSTLPVREVSGKLKVKPDYVYVIAPNTNLSIDDGVLSLRPRPRTRTPNRSVDFFFEALARDQGARAIGVVLSGAATDGTTGLEAIKAEGGITFAQDDSARYDSMPRSAVASGCVDFVLAPEAIAEELARISTHPSVAGADAELFASDEDDAADALAHKDDDAALPSGGDGAAVAAEEAAQTEPGQGQAKAGAIAGQRRTADGFGRILRLLRDHSGVDFLRYKATTIRRRITRRMVLTHQETLAQYGEHLRGNSDELHALYADSLISVTSFFRDPDSFEVLERKVFPALQQQRGNDPVRVWVLGCSTGQEAYSIAMAYVEAAEKATRRVRKLQIFATDLNDALLDQARQGLYTKSLAQDIAPERLRRFFAEEQGGYRVNKSLREMVVFARHNLIGDPPFSRIDLISCRNLLIYLQSGLQRSVIPMFHYALRLGGYLYLGASESVGGFTELFAPVHRKHRIYTRKSGPTLAHQMAGRNGRVAGDVRAIPEVAMDTKLLPSGSRHAEPAVRYRAGADAEREADRITVNQFAPPGVLVNAELQILQFRGSTSPYLEPPTGRASFELLKMTRDGLTLPLRSLINQAKKDNKTARKERVRIGRDGSTRSVNLEVVPLKNLPERCFLVVFEDPDQAWSGRAAEAGPAGGSKGGRKRTEGAAGSASAGGDGRRIAELETELAEMREYQQSIREDHEAVNEELQTSNEEIESANEELQSLNEELETSKEELESSNEELMTVNEEMVNHNRELNRLNSDLVNIQNSTSVPIVLLGVDLTVRRFSAPAEKQLHLSATDVGRSLASVRHQLGMKDLEAFVAEAIESVRASEREVQDRDGHWWSLRVSPYLTLDKKVDGAVLVMVDVDHLKSSEQAIAAERDFAESVLRAARDPMLILDADLRLISANAAFYKTFHMSAAHSEGRLIYELGEHEWDIPELRRLLEQILASNREFNDFEVSHDFERVGRRTMLLNARTLIKPNGAPGKILLGIQDISQRKVVEEEMRESDRNKNEFLAMLAHELRNPLAPIRNSLEIMRRGAEAAPAERSPDSGSPRGEEPDRLLSYVGVMDRQVDQMVRLIDDLLDVSRISRGKIGLRKERFELSTVLRVAEANALPSCRRTDQQLTVTLPQEPLLVTVDPTRLIQIVGNLLSNACKFSPPGGQVALTAERDTATPSDVVIRVSDTGIGIAAEQLPHIFDMFMQVDTRLERTTSGLGIGLALVKNLVELHAGTIEARSAGIGKGTEFVVRMPIADGVQQLVPDPAPADPATVGTTFLQGRRIMVVDDNRDAADSLALALQLRGAETAIAYSGPDALTMAARFRPDIALLDIGLPQLNGFEVAQRMKQGLGAPGVSLVALTGWGQEEVRRRALDAGFDGFLVKPVDYKVLQELLAKLVAD